MFGKFGKTEKDEQQGVLILYLSLFEQVEVI